jgi:transposase-like protein
MAKRKNYTAEQVIIKLREAEVLLGQGKNVKEACRALEVSEQTYYRWRKEYGGLNTTQAKKLKELEKENARLKRLVADLSLDNAILKEVLSKKKSARTGVARQSSKCRMCWTCLRDVCAGYWDSLARPRAKISALQTMKRSCLRVLWH